MTHDPFDITHYHTTSLRDVRVNTDLVTVAYDPEFADFENPRGAIIRARYWIEIVTGFGAPFEGVRFYHNYVFENEAEAEAFAEKVSRAIADGRKPDPRHWQHSGFVYGSEAYQRLGGEEDLIAWERDHDGGYF